MINAINSTDQSKLVDDLVNNFQNYLDTLTVEQQGFIYYLVLQ